MVISTKRIPRGTRIRVLVVDDSVVIRRLVIQALEPDAQLEIVGSASNGAIALQRVPQLNPDVITLDVEMPDMDGLQFLRNFRPHNKDVRVIMFSTLTERGATSTMEALSLGADDYVTKVSNVGSLDRSMEALRSELIPKIKQFFDLEAVPKSLPIIRKTVLPAALPGLMPRAVAIGISTGGPAALGEIIPQFPADFPLPIFIVQHMPPVFTRLLAERLQVSANLKIHEAAQGMNVEGGHVYIAPGDFHMRVKKNGLKVSIALDQGPHENSCRPAVDVLFRSVDEVYGSQAVAAVLTGMGYDGLRGVEVMRATGTYIIAQDQATSVVWGMPGAIANGNLANVVLPLKQIVPEILRVARHASELAAPVKRVSL
jgi:two-component system, chemotaxis family, protein-glutamate methylesterase/glutaminase